MVGLDYQFSQPMRTSDILGSKRRCLLEALGCVSEQYTLMSLSKTLSPLFSTGSTQEDTVYNCFSREIRITSVKNVDD